MMLVSPLHIILLGIVLFYCCASLHTFNKVYYTAHTVIDEEFHIPQGLAYCNFNLTTWNPKITTLPGLYMLSMVLLGPLNLCTTYWLRFVNYLGGIVNLCLFLVWLWPVDKKGDDVQKLPAVLTSFNLAILPPLYFFTNLYYTDIISIMFVLLLFVFAKYDNHVYAAFCGFLSVIVRQTNIIWVGMMYADYILKQFHHYCIMSKLKKINTYTYEISKKDLQNLTPHLFGNFANLRNMPIRVSLNIYCYFATIMLFIMFVVKNGGIVVGDKTAHTAGIHIPQLFYFSLFCLVFAWPHFLSLVVPFYKYVCKHVFFTIFIISVMMIIVRVNTLVHPYLLADNRHYTFYIWSRFYQNIAGFRYLIIPVYFFGVYSILSTVYRKGDVSFALVYLPSIIIVLTLQKMIEVRYFLIPFIILRSRIRCTSHTLLFMEMFTYVLINIFTLTIFFKKNIYWTDFGYIQKLIW